MASYIFLFVCCKALVFASLGKYRLEGFQMRINDVGDCSLSGFKSARLCHKDTSGQKVVYTVDKCNQGGKFFGRFVYINTIKERFLHIGELQAFGTENKLGNLALNQPAISSSVNNGNVASRSNDGRTNTWVYTKKDNPTWWCVELQTVYDFTSIVVFNPDDSGKYRLKGFQIRINENGDCSEAGFKAAGICHKDTSGVKVVYTVDKCNQGVKFIGRFVYINSIDGHLMHPAEVQVFGIELNLALNQPSVSSSVAIYGPGRGNDDNIYNYMSTNIDNPSWWCVRLLNINDFSSIVVYNSADSSNDRLKGFQIRVNAFGDCSAGGFKRARLCHTDTSGVQKAYTVDKCNQGGKLSGRFVYINTASGKNMQIAEVEVFGKVRYILPNIAVGNYIMQSSTNGLNTAKLANDDKLSTCSATNVEGQAWLCLDLEGNHILDSIILKGDVSGYEIRLDPTDHCHAEGFKMATVCYKDTTGEKTIHTCNQGNNVLFDARSIYISVANKALKICDINVRPVFVSSSCTWGN